MNSQAERNYNATRRDESSWSRRGEGERTRSLGTEESELTGEVVVVAEIGSPDYLLGLGPRSAPSKAEQVW